MAPTRTDPIILYRIQIGPKHFIINPVSDYNKPVNTTRNEAITSYNMLISVLYLQYLFRLGMRGFVSIWLHFIFEILRKNIWYSCKKYAHLARIEIFIPNPTRAENILQNVSRYWSGFGPVQSQPGKLGLHRRSLNHNNNLDIQRVQDTCSHTVIRCWQITTLVSF